MWAVESTLYCTWFAVYNCDCHIPLEYRVGSEPTSSRNLDMNISLRIQTLDLPLTRFHQVHADPPPNNSEFVSKTSMHSIINGNSTHCLLRVPVPNTSIKQTPQEIIPKFQPRQAPDFTLGIIQEETHPRNIPYQGLENINFKE